MVRILDTDICIAILRGHREVIQCRKDLTVQVATTQITSGELYYGAAKSLNPFKNKKLVDQFLSTLPTIGIDRSSAQLFGLIKADLEGEGRRLADADLWIAAMVRANQAVLVTGNVRHYNRVKCLKLENWLKDTSGQ
jgi:tRNA(fMet)-specific endonuclease VapC